MNDRQTHIEHFERQTHRVCEINQHPAFAQRRKSDKRHELDLAFDHSDHVEHTSGSKLADFLWFWLPITFRLAVENLYRRVNWWGLFVLCMCVLSSALVTIGIFGMAGQDLSALVHLMGLKQ